jgi:signal transduction histidine kinase
MMQLVRVADRAHGLHEVVGDIARLRLVDLDGTVSFTVIDDGTGFDPARTPLGTGLQGMKDRREAVGGTLTVDSSPGGGTSVAGTIPFRAPAPASPMPM